MRLSLLRCASLVVFPVAGLVIACGDGTSLPEGRWGGGQVAGSGGATGTGTTGSSGGSTGSSSGGVAGSSGSGTASSSGSGGGSSGGSSSGSSSGSAGSSGGSGGGSGSSSGAPAAPPNLSVALDHTSLQLELLAKGTLQVSVSPNGYVGPVQLQLGAMPAGLTGTFSPATLNLDGTTAGTATLTLATLDSSPPGSATLDVQASAAGMPFHASASVDVLSKITIHIPQGVNGLGGTISNPVTDAYGPYPFKIVAPSGMSTQTPVTVYFMNDDGQSHEIHADNPNQGFGHDPGTIAPHSMDSYVRQVNTPGTYTFYLHDQGAPITIGMVEIQ